jgi:YVTN family beta-propeller protein
MKIVRWSCFTLLLWIGAIATKDVIHFSQAAAVDETYCFSGYYTAGRLMLLGEAKGNLQDWDWFRAQTRRYGFKATDVFFGNPPSAALLMTPIAGLPHRQARIVWTWLTLTFWVAGVALLGFTVVRYAQGSFLLAAPTLLCLAMMFAPLKANIEVGQVYVLIFLLQSIYCWLWLTKRTAAAGALAGAVLALKGYGVPLIALGILRRDWRFTGAAVGSFAALATLSGVLMGFRHWADFLVTHQSALFSGMPTPALQTLKSFLIVALHLPTVESGPIRILTPTADRLLFLVLTTVLAALLLWLSEFRLFRKQSDTSAIPPSPAALSACVLLSLVFSPRAEDYAYSIAMTAMLLMIPELRKVSITTAGVILGGILLSWPFHLQDRTVMTASNLLGDFARLWGAVILLMAALVAEYRRRRGTTLMTNKPMTYTWNGAYLTCSVGLILTLWYAKPWRDPVKNGPLLAVSRTNGNRVTLVRLDIEEREVSTIPVSCVGPFGIAFGPKRDWLYTACTDNSHVSLVDLRKRREAQPFPTPRLPAWAQQREGSDEMWISNEGTGTVTIYRVGSSAVLGELATGTGPSDIVFTDRGRRAWVSNELSGTVSLLDAERRQKIRDISVGHVPQGMALTSKADRLLVANFQSNTISVLDTASAQELGQIPVCQGPVDVTTSRRGGHELAYVTCFGSGSVGVVDIDQRAEIQRIDVGEKPFGIAAHPNGERVYVCVGGSNRIVVIETGKPSRILRRMKMDGDPLQIAVTP